MARTILILEDALLLRKQLQRLFQARGYDVYIARTIGDFLAEARQRQFDAVVFDLTLPDGDGLAAWAEARPVQPTAFSVLMTASGTPEIAARARTLGIGTVLAKPIDVARLLALIAGAAAAT